MAADVDVVAALPLLHSRCGGGALHRRVPGCTLGSRYGLAFVLGHLLAGVGPQLLGGLLSLKMILTLLPLSI